ncbi:MAG TPA: hypothetical protein VK539_10910 [Myxococcaceae bacterium]|nr:hypothetical protein [Myxococcaceae bacterium]
MNRQIMPPSALALEAVLVKAQQGERAAQLELYKTCASWLNQVAKKRCTRLGISPQEVRDVVQETLVRLLDPKRQTYAQYLTKRKARDGLCEERDSGNGAPHDYIGGVVWNAIGFAKRRRRAVHEAEHGVEDASTANTVTPMMEGGDFKSAEKPSMEGPGSSAALEAHVAAREILAVTSPLTRALAIEVYCHEVPAVEAGKVLGISKFKASRLLKRFREDARLMLAA